MASSLHEYTDSEDEPPPSHEPHTTAGQLPIASSSQSREASGSASVERSPKAHTGTRVKLTLRPTINHLINPAPDPPPASDRSSLSPPPPITLRLGMRQPTTSSIAEKASYSSSDDASSDLDHERPAKKARKSATSPSKKKKVHPPPQPVPGDGVPAAHRKSYDWLQPSTAGASHHGPPERSKITGWTPADDEIVPKQEIEEPKPKKSSKKKADPAQAPSGPTGGTGKAWRKGIKKGMPIPWKEPGSFTDTGSGIVTPGEATPLEGSPEPGSITSELPAVPRAPSPPFVLADAKKLGFPVFAKPIVAPKINLGPFPKVTQYFQPNNGGDTGRFPRKEKVRTFTFTDKSIVGIGGGTFKFKSWARGPPSELGRLIQADKEAKELQRQKPKATPAATPAVEPPVPGWESQRPPLLSNLSSESTPTASVLEPSPAEEVEIASEIGDGEESVISTKDSPAPRPRVKAKAKPRKSKLAQEIHPVSESTSAIEDVI